MHGSLHITAYLMSYQSRCKPGERFPLKKTKIPPKTHDLSTGPSGTLNLNSKLFLPFYQTNTSYCRSGSVNLEKNILYENRLWLGIVSQSINTILSFNSRLLDSSKRNLAFDFGSAIYLSCSRLEFLWNSHGTINILSEYCSTQSKLGIVGAGNSFIFRFKGIYNDDRTENFVSFNRCIRLCVDENCRLDKKALISDQII